MKTGFQYDVGHISSLTAQSCRRLLAFAWVAYDANAEVHTLQAQVIRAYTNRTITSDDIYRVWIMQGAASRERERAAPKSRRGGQTNGA